MKIKGLRYSLYSIFLVGVMFFLNNSNIFATITGNIPKSEISDVFPDSYNVYLNELKKQHPNWVFKAVYVKQDWNEILKHETYEVNEGISLVPDSSNAAWKKDGKNYYKDGNFVIASKGAVGYVLDPRNFLNESSIFQFETLNYSENVHNKDTVEKVFWGTSLWNRNQYLRLNEWKTMDKTYSQIVMEAGKKYNISPIHIATRMIQETGGKIDTNKSINGSTVVNGNVPYNFFNIGATPDANGNNSVTNGLIYAENQGWLTPEASINGGVSYLGASYIDRGQNTMYFQKFDVNNENGNLSALCAHQYMTNIMAPLNEAKRAYTSYLNAGMLDSAFEFHIPVYENMPSTPARVEDEYTYEKDATYMEVYNCSPVKLNVRSGPSTSYPVIATASDGDIVLRIGKNTTSQWDKIRLDNGIEGYVSNAYLKDTNIPNIALLDDCFIINRGETLTLSPFFSNTTNKEYSIQIDNPVVATVVDGKIVGKVEGQTAFTLKLDGTDKTAIGYLKVEDNSSISLVNDCYFSNVGEEVKLNLEITGTQDKNYEIIIDNPKVAEVKDGKIYGKIEGQTAFIVKLNDTNKQVKGYLKVTDNRNIKFITDCYETGIGEAVNLKMEITGVQKEYEITIDNPRVAEVKDGKIYGKIEGQTAFTVKLKGLDRKVTGYLKVVDNRNITFVNDCYETGIGETFDLNLKITGSVKEYEITIDNPRVAEVKDGKIYGKIEGQTAFIVKLKGLDRKVTGYLKVVDNRNISFVNDCYETGIGETFDLNLKITGSVKEYEITIDNPRVAEVKDGKIYGKIEGQTAFTVKLKGLDRKVTGYLKVVDNRNISFVNDCYEAGIGETVNLNLKITGSVKEYDIIVDNPKVAKIVDGKLIGNMEGQTAFTVKLKGLDKKAIGYLKVVDNSTLSLSQENYITGIEEVIDIKLDIEGPNKNYSIEVDNPVVSSVVDNKLKGNLEGQTKFTVKLYNSKNSVDGYLRVIDNTNITMTDENYVTELNDFVDLKLNIDGPNQNYTIEVDNPVVAQVVDGKLKATCVGQTKFTVRLNNSSKYVVGYLRVEDNSNIVLNNKNYFANVNEYINLDISIFGTNKEYDIIVDNPVVAQVVDGKLKATCVGQTAFTVKLKSTGKTDIGYLKVEE